MAQHSGEALSSAEAEAYRQEKLVAHFRDGDVARGYSPDFRPEKEVFHLMSWDGDVTSSRKIQVNQLKALFHVKTWGTPGGHRDRRKEFPRGEAPAPVEKTDAPRTIAAAIIPNKGRRLAKSSFLMNRKRIFPTRMATRYPETQSQTGKTPSGK